MNEDQKELDYNRKRDKDPSVTYYWIAEPSNRNPVRLNALSCLFCKRTLITEVRGTINKVVNGPINLAEFGLSATMRCKYCHQNYRLVISQTYLG